VTTEKYIDRLRLRGLNQMNDKENCKGCGMIRNSMFCYMRMHEKSHICACSSCLVKVMCDEQDICSKRSVSFEHIRGELENGNTFEK
jgi:hypothetical protein